MTIATRIKITPCTLGLAIVAISAITIPVIPNQLPYFAVSCFDKPARLAINSTAATMYEAVTKP
jgi:hypothetical protein